MRTAIAFLWTLVISTSAHWWEIGEDLIEQRNAYGAAWQVSCPKYNLTREQERFCKDPTNRDFVISMGQGVNVVAQTCNSTFRNKKWNCTYFGGRDPFGRIAYQESREAAYLYAIMSAMGMYTVTRNCAKSKIVNCNCGDKPREPSPGFDWGRCTEDVNFGYAKTKEFIDAAETPNSRGVYSAAGQMNIQNNEAGRLMVKNEMVTKCQCHGFSGSCEVKTCWKEMKPWREVFEDLKDKYDSSVEVVLDTRSNRLRNFHANDKRFEAEDLVYLKDSPNLCDPNPSVGALGTRGRSCSSLPSAENSCSVLCCGRGRVLRVHKKVSACHCTLRGFGFKCETCTEQITESFCK